jgi:AcrR family transcriptional regulator
MPAKKPSSEPTSAPSRQRASPRARETKKLPNSQRPGAKPQLASLEQASSAPQPAVERLSWENAIKGAPVPQSTRERILHEAITLLNDEGFAALTQQRVCERAGVRQSHLTYYFPTRNALLREVAVYGCEAMLDDMAAGIKSLSLPEVRELLFCADESDRRFGRLMASLIVASDEDISIKPWLAAFEAENRGKLLSLLSSAGAAVNEADIELLHAAYVGAVMLDIGESSPESLARTQRIVHRIFDVLVAPNHAASAKHPAARRTTSRKKS